MLGLGGSGWSLWDKVNKSQPGPLTSASIHGHAMLASAQPKRSAAELALQLPHPQRQTRQGPPETQTRWRGWGAGSGSAGASVERGGFFNTHTDTRTGHTSRPCPPPPPPPFPHQGFTLLGTHAALVALGLQNRITRMPLERVVRAREYEDSGKGPWFAHGASRGLKMEGAPRNLSAWDPGKHAFSEY